MINLKQSLETEVAELTERLGEEEGGNEKLLSSKKKLEKQVEEMSQDVESAEGNIKRLEKEKGVSFYSPYYTIIKITKIEYLEQVSRFLGSRVKGSWTFF